MPAENFFHAFYNNAPTVGKTWDWHAVLLDIQKNGNYAVNRNKNAQNRGK